jgi:hypothetical protein
MSYDLFLTSPRLSLDAFNQYFAGRTNFTKPGWYANSDTGVYFSFEYNIPAPAKRAQGEYVAFNLNYFRPHTFGLEAEPEVSAFVEAFGCVIQDPQMDGMGSGPYSASGFLRGWNKGNAFGYMSVGGKAAPDILLADEALIQRTWKWNLRRKERQAQFGESHFLPLINWGKRPSDRAPIAFAAWGEGVRSAFPDCATHVLLMRKRSISTGMFGRKKEQVLVSNLMSIDEIGSIEGCEWYDVAGERFLLAPTKLPPSRSLVSIFEGLSERPEALVTRYSPDHVLGSSMMAEAVGGGSG